MPIIIDMIRLIILTVLCQQPCSLSSNVIDLANVLITLGLDFTKLVLKGAAHLLKISLETNIGHIQSLNKPTCIAYLLSGA